MADTPEESADHTSQQYYQFDVHQYFSVLRLFYARLPRAAPSSSYTLINYVTFTPVQLLPGESTEVDYEKMRQTMVRVTAWIKAAGRKAMNMTLVVVTGKWIGFGILELLRPLCHESCA